MPSAPASRDRNAPLTSTHSVPKNRAPLSLATVMAKLKPARLPLEVSLWIANRLASELVDSHEGVGGAVVHGRLSPHFVQLGFDGSVSLEGFGDEPAGADVLTDVQMLGAVLYELCAGMTVADALARGGGKLPAPSDLNPGLDPSLDDLLLSALAEDAAERPYSVREILGRIVETYEDLDLTPNPQPLMTLLSDKAFAEVASAPTPVKAVVAAPVVAAPVAAPVKAVVAAPVVAAPVAAPAPVVAAPVVAAPVPAVVKAVAVEPPVATLTLAPVVAEDELSLTYSEPEASSSSPKESAARPELRLAAAPGDIVSTDRALQAERSHAVDVIPEAAPLRLEKQKVSPPSAEPVPLNLKQVKRVLTVQAKEEAEFFEQDENDFLGSRPSRFGAASLTAKLASLKPLATRRNLAIAFSAVVLVLFAASRPSPATLLIRSEPAGASVTIDGRSVGQTPLTLHKVKSGPHAVKIQKDGFEPQASQLTVRAGSEPELQVALKAKVVAVAPPAALAGVQVVQGNFKSRSRPSDKKLAMGEAR